MDEMLLLSWWLTLITSQLNFLNGQPSLSKYKKILARSEAADLSCVSRHHLNQDFRPEQWRKHDGLEQQFLKHGSTDLWGSLSTFRGTQEVRTICLFHGVDICVVSAKVMLHKGAAMLAPITAVVPNCTESLYSSLPHALKIKKKGGASFT